MKKFIAHCDAFSEKHTKSLFERTNWLSSHFIPMFRQVSASIAEAVCPTDVSLQHAIIYAGSQGFLPVNALSAPSPGRQGTDSRAPSIPEPYVQDLTPIGGFTSLLSPVVDLPGFVGRMLRRFAHWLWRVMLFVLSAGKWKVQNGAAAEVIAPKESLVEDTNSRGSSDNRGGHWKVARGGEDAIAEDVCQGDESLSDERSFDRARFES
jgi:hypothetical protein